LTALAGAQLIIQRAVLGGAQDVQQAAKENSQQEADEYV